MRFVPEKKSLLGESLESFESEILAADFPKYRAKQVFDWIVPQEWELDRATLKTTDGELIIDTLESNLHVLNFSEPFSGIVNFDELNQHLYSIPDIPEAVPYVTSYYKSRWGLCITENKRKTLRKDINYIVDIKTKKYDGHLRYGDCLLEGDTDDTFLITSYLLGHKN